ncbi:hypothetical protein EDB19DRAFT_1911300 [Suillus lakei]|nr:hypothetical protein EDB19DRAFT_1911300 [Suillus lakei]
MPPRSRAMSSPKRLKAKHKVADDNPALTGQGKKARAADNIGLVSLQLTPDPNAPAIHRSGRPGAGTGGRNAQLEKVGAVLEAPARTSQPKGSTTLVPNISANPLAPASYRKGRGGCSKPPPPPYSVSDVTGSTIKSSRQKGKKGKTTSASSQVEPDVTRKPNHASSQPGLMLRKTGGRFGFQTPQGDTPIVPPGTEPDLQALNNPYIAMAKKNAQNHNHNAVQSLTGGHQSPFNVLVNGDLQHSVPPSVPLSRHSSAARVIPTFSEEHLDPSLQTVGYEPKINLSSQQLDSDDLDTSDSGESNVGGEDDDDPADSDDTGEKEFGWAEVGKRHLAHPGFSREPEPSPVHVTSTLAPDFDFQYSCDEVDMNAEQRLAFDNPSSNDSASEGVQCVPQEPADSQPAIVDVLNQHHTRNGRPNLPDPASLHVLCHPAETKGSKNDEDPVNMQQQAKAKRSPDGPRPTQLMFYPIRWKSFLEDAKGACRAQHALENPFPAFIKDSPGSVTEALLAVLVQWDAAGKQFEPGYWPIHKPNMSKLISLYEDLSTWRSELKKNVVLIASTMPGLVPPPTIPPQECPSWVERAAAELKVGSKFLRDGVDEQGKTRNFANPALRDIIIMFVYTGPYRIARRHPDIFSKQLPLSCLALVSAAFICVLDGLIKNGNGKSMLNFAAKEYGPTYSSALKSLEDIIKHPYHGPKLIEQL